MSHPRIFSRSSAFKAIVDGLPFLRREVSFGTHFSVPTIFVTSYRALVRVVGHYKYNESGFVLMRGQTMARPTMIPNAYRESNPAIIDSYIEGLLERYRKAFNCDPEPEHQLTTEALIQHYGIRTRWLDLVDSLPHALFFSLHSLCTSPFDSQVLTYTPSIGEYGYLYLLDFGNVTAHQLNAVDTPGVLIGHNGLMLCDLRATRSSHALRPHVQHGWLVRPPAGISDLWKDYVVAQIAFPTEQGRQWIGGTALTREAMFPPRLWDHIYGTLVADLQSFFTNEKIKAPYDIGSIQKFDFHQPSSKSIGKQSLRQNTNGPRRSRSMRGRDRS